MDKIAEIKGVLRQLGITPDLNGYHYLLKGVRLIRDDFNSGKTPRSFMCVYKDIANEFGKSYQSVERCIRTCVELARNSNTELFDILFGNLNVVTSSCFISIVAEYVS